MQIPKLLAILGPTGCGKSDLAIELALRLDAEIFSLDSLSIYKHINILSAKPSQVELTKVHHYGIDILEISQENNAMLFKKLLLEAIKTTKKKILILVGGSSFYLKAICEGLSILPNITKEIREQVSSIPTPYAFLQSIDPIYAARLKPKDPYRITKALEIYFSSKMIPSAYFQAHPPLPFPYKIEHFCIAIKREFLREKITLRTQKMLDLGGIEEIETLLRLYPKSSQPFRAIGPKECIAYLNKEINKEELKTLITTHTMQLAKRQQTFNRTQFSSMTFLEKPLLFDKILKHYENSNQR
ncbi:tRNA (adenosine(37)-N6)-dimethylallyltransferase MiaA [Helicobacter mustelae]|uniref:tRNA dimethylallyltransferase n=1 Tax=Helicobacter mustelae (strain ATCC 43772 / CCUG 25715 / CIP 103759 / LMG 18044 / NCTC 12198 / R85-136P) TaxID=679897 RepID=D3UIW2_HELM1|nr:tRNA (adenosine(37)-N6)-dimethylallyltransferase MiaA [Helicobacter mustelae]CBG40437.1 tRNA delta(2)-isopentenylpyrophosphate transferase [Helicobacter mustelae 12198]SQH71937.1 tRNA delta(2)-isopentenylpyrophosphate transferase [Helicobacter mustelae]